MSVFASGKYAFGECDRCGFRYPYLTLKEEIGTKSRVCPTCHDGMNDRINDPLNFPSDKVGDNIALKDARPGSDEE